MSEEQIGKYKILKELGKGSMGVVYLAEDPEIGRQVAIKTLRSIYLGEDAAGQEALQRFRQESRSAGRLKHANIITIFEAGRSQLGSPFIVMEFIDGESLEESLASSKKFEALEALHLLAQTASAIDYAHTFEIIHRDIKPSNVILDSARKPYLLDFGVAKLNDTSLTPAGTVVGTPSYMAPEQIRGEGLTSATDRFAFAVLAYEMLTGVRPFPGSDFMSVASNIIHADPIKFSDGGIDLDPKFEVVLRKGLSKAQAERYPSCLEFVRELGKQFDIPINQSGVLGFRLGMTLQDLYPAPTKSSAPTGSQKVADSDVAATMMGQIPSEIKKPAKLVQEPKVAEKKAEKKIETNQQAQGLKEGGGKGVAIVAGALFFLFVAGGVYYLLQNENNSAESVESAKSISNLVEKTEPTVELTNTAISEATPGCGLGVACSVTSEGVTSVGPSILAQEALTPPTEAVTLKSINPEVPLIPEFAATNENSGLLNKLLSPDISSEKLIELIPTVGKLSYEESGPVLLKLVAHPEYRVRIAVLKVFTSADQYRTREVFRTIVDRLDDKEFLVRGFSAKFLASLKNEAAKKILSDRLVIEKDPTVRKVIESALRG